VDAICINQDYISERSHQIVFMGDIYEKAFETLVWLGEAADESELAFHFIAVWANANEDFDEFFEACPFALNEEMREAVDKFFKRPWWTRIWVYQEFAFSNNVMFLCRSNYIPFEVLFAARTSWKNLPSSAMTKLPSTKLENAQQYRTWKRTGRELDIFSVKRYSHEYRRAHSEPNSPQDTTLSPIDLLKLLLITRDMQATDPRDKLYGILSLDEVQDIAVIPKYEHSMHKVYTEFAVNCITARSNLEILIHAGIGDVLPDSQLPSWVPDLRQFGSSGKKGHWPKEECASGKYNWVPQIDATHSLLSAGGLVCDTIVAFNPPEEELKTHSQWAVLAQNSCRDHPTGISLAQAFFRTMTGDCTGYGFGRPEFRDEQEKEQFFDLLRGFVLHSHAMGPKWWHHDNELEEQFHVSASQYKNSEWCWNLECFIEEEDEKFIYSYIMHFRKVTNRRSFYLTRNRYMGLGPANVQTGDMVCILFGCPRPLLLRKFENSYLLVGDAYVYGMMRGEMIAEYEAGKLAEEQFVIK
jgi:hypothetical protein